MAKKKRDQSPTGDTHDLPGMVLEVNDFGPIQKGRVDLRPLTVFAGPSNTGKSWLAILIYVMERHVEEMFSIFHVHGFFTKRHQYKGSSPDSESDDRRPFPENPERWRRELKARSEVCLTTEEVETIREFIEFVSSRNLENEFQRCYGVKEASDLIRQGYKGGARLSIHSGQIGHRLNLAEQLSEMSLKIDMPERTVLYTDQNDELYFNELIEDLGSVKASDRERDIMRYIDGETGLAAGLIWKNLYSRAGNQDAYYLPADRGGVMHAHSVVVSALIRGASRAALRREPPLPALSGILGDFLEELIKIAELGGRGNTKPHSPDYLVQILEDRVLRGAVEVERGETDYPRFVYRPRGWQRSLPLMNVSSMISELTPVALYLRYLVSPGDLLIIEEPEAHLHPAMQARFIEAIAAAVQAGIRVLLTTHSEWVLEKLANIVARGEMKKDGGWEVREGMASDRVGLSSKDVGVWLFDFADRDRPEQGSEVTEVLWDMDDGGYATGFDEVGMALHNDWAELMSQKS